jgi:Flp pilus assembly protein TadG
MPLLPADAGTRLGKRPGGAALEFAVLLPFLGLMLTAAVDFARVFQATQILQQCASAGAMYASGTSVAAQATGATQAATTAACAAGASLAPPLQAENVTVAVDQTAQTATVTVTWCFQLITPVLAPGGQVQLTRTVVMNLAPVPGA